MANTFENNFITGNVYRLSCKDEAVKDCYIGSSINLMSRLSKHKNNSNNPNSEKHHLKIYQKIREYGGWDNWKCEVLDTLENPTRKQLIQLERMYYEEQIENATLNTTYCGRTKKECNTNWWNNNPNYMKEYREKNPERVKAINDKYYLTNRDEILARWRTKKTCECGCVVNTSAMSRHLNSAKHKKLMDNL